MKKDSVRPGGLSSDDGAASVSTLRASIPDATMARSWLVGMTKQGEDRIWRGAERVLAYHDGMAAQMGYLREHHHITESMIGILLLHATPETKATVQSYCDQLGLLSINRLLDMGVPPENIGENALFHEDDRLVAQAMETRRAGTEGSDAKHDSAVPEGDAP
ncbi:MAG: hypothetical protein V4527_18285 [Pseudomonadota bacterium]